MTDLSASKKASHLVALFGHRGFECAGDSWKDLPVWAASCGAIVVGQSKSLLWTASEQAPIVQVVAPQRPSLRTYAVQMRVHQWLKNLLVFVPMLAAHQFSNGTLTKATLAFIALSLCESGVYLLHDLLAYFLVTCLYSL